MKKLICLFIPVAVISAEVRLAWDASPDSNAVAHYQLYTWTNSPTDNSVAITNINAGTNLTAQIEPLSSGNYWFAVSAVGTNGLESDLSDVLSVEIQRPPANMRTLAVQYSTTLSNWSDVGFFRLKIPAE